MQARGPTRQDLLWLLQGLSGSSSRPYGFKIVELWVRAVDVDNKGRGGKGREGCRMEVEDGRGKDCMRGGSGSNEGKEERED
jgi:hypothetical protein